MSFGTKKFLGEAITPNKLFGKWIKKSPDEFVKTPVPPK